MSMSINIFGLNIVKSGTIERLEQDLRWHKSRGKRLDTDLIKANERIVELAAQLESEKVITKTLGDQKLEALANLDKAQNDVNAHVAELKRRDNGSAHVTKKISIHNDTLYAAGKILSNLVTAWSNRQQNPKMGPKDRAANNNAISNAIQELQLQLPKKLDLGEVDDAEAQEPGSMPKRKTIHRAPYI